jgi:hypothetical protein
MGKSVRDVFISFAIAIFIYTFLCLVGSAIKLEGRCGKTYPIDYIIYSDLFCEIKK